ncbi:hypothetical protein [Formosa sp. PL04]|uniref:hypothetical protein n=1 Tax=Formosa sp. PL04 TaxID=3081755 RepID=UPI0029824CA4|nr:hypothetical protein [Formosa sp. PL04]MDW5290838.1 hypothetical protein [Formosa sp. PL04]
MKNYILLLALSIFLLISCSSNERKLIIDDFSKKFTDTLVPQEGRGYGAAVYEINGEANDTIIIRFNGIEKRYYGSFKYKFNMDYYGGRAVGFEFDPYLAKKGKIDIKYGIY